MTRKPPTAQRLEGVRRARAQERRATLRKVALGASILVAIAGAAYGLSLIPEGPKNVHWHPTWEVYVNDQNVVWTGTRDFDMAGMGSGMHFHQPNDNTIHAESRSDRLTLGGLLTRLGGGIEDDRLDIPAPATNAGSYEATQEKPLRVFVQPPGEDWEEVTSGFASLLFVDKGRVLVTYAPSEEGLVAQKESVAQPPA